MFSIARIFEVMVATAFYSGLVYMFYDGTARRVGKVGSAVLPAVWPARDPSVLVVTALHNQPCSYPRGDHLNFLSIMNKQDYARLHGYPIVATAIVADPTLPNSWNKIGWLLRAYREFPTAEWYMWVDSDAMIVDPTFEIPFNQFGGKDLVAWGNEEQLRAGNALAGFNSGVMLFRRSKWTKQFLEAVAELGRVPEPELGERLKSELSAPDYEYDAGLRDQNGIVYQLKRDGARALSHVKLVNWGYCLNCYWRDLQGRDNFTYSDQQVQFVDHFSGCQLCTQQSKDKGAYRECEAEFLRSYEFASGALRELEPPPAPRNATHFKQLAATPYCLGNTKAKECREAAAEAAKAAEDEAAALEAQLDADADGPQPLHRRLLGLVA